MDNMRKFTIIHRKGTTAVQEVECMEAFCHPWEVRPGEKKYCISAPEELKNQLLMSWALTDTEGDALAKANIELRGEFERDSRKSHTELNEAKFLAAVDAIKVVRL